MCEIIDKHRSNIARMQGVVAGDLNAHVWRSPRFPGADIALRITSPEEEVTAESHGLPDDFAAEIETVYAGTLTREEAAVRLANLQAVGNTLDI